MSLSVALSILKQSKQGILVRTYHSCHREPLVLARARPAGAAAACAPGTVQTSASQVIAATYRTKDFFIQNNAFNTSVF